MQIPRTKKVPIRPLQKETDVIGFSKDGDDARLYIEADGKVYEVSTTDTSVAKELPSGGGSGGTTKFDALTDTPSSKSGQSLKAVRVNSGETALEYSDAVGNANVDTEKNILTSTSADGASGLTNDTHPRWLLFYDATAAKWFATQVFEAIEFNAETTIGAFPIKRDYGYELGAITGKKLHNIDLGNHANRRNGSIWFEIDDKKYKVSIDGIIKNIITLTDEELDDIILWDDFTDELSSNGKPVIHGHKTDIGAFQGDLLISGGRV